MVFYLKYRPKNIKELDSSFLREKLESVLAGKLPDDIPHAFLFTGPRGLGKTSTARIIAKAINCTNRNDGEIEPCNKCDSCKSITNGSNLDVIEIDAASNRGIDEIRDLREKIRLAPISSKKKVYIIDEVHMLTTEAFNALLKTLEEPPSHAVFILCTTEPHKVPDTIASRCFHIKLSKATDADLINSFQRIAKGEGIKAEKDALLKIAKLSDGSFRDGVKILEELSTNSLEITLDLIEKKYKTQSITKYVDDLVSSLAQKDVLKGIRIVDSLVKEGVDLKFFTEELINKLHQEMLNQINGESSDLSVDQTKNLIEKLVKSHVSIKYAILPQLPLELSIVEWCSLDIENQEAGIINSSFAKTLADRSADKQELRETRQGVEKFDNDTSLSLQSTKGVFATSSIDPKHDKILLDLIGEVKKENFSVAGVLRGCRIEKFDSRELILSTGFKFHKERLSDKKVLEMLESLINKITNKKINVSIILK